MKDLLGRDYGSPVANDSCEPLPVPSHAHAEICPICKGKGKDPQDKTKQCHSCSFGCGWVTVHD